jgi:hypothetical protein
MFTNAITTLGPDEVFHTNFFFERTSTRTPDKTLRYYAIFLYLFLSMGFIFTRHNWDAILQHDAQHNRPPRFVLPAFS